MSRRDRFELSKDASRILFKWQKDAEAPFTNRHTGDVLDADKNHRKTQKPYQQEKCKPRRWI
jgi:hypothetical protein